MSRALRLLLSRIFRTPLARGENDVLRVQALVSFRFRIALGSLPQLGDLWGSLRDLAGNLWEFRRVRFARIRAPIQTPSGGAVAGLTLRTDSPSSAAPSRSSLCRAQSQGFMLSFGVERECPALSLHEAIRDNLGQSGTRFARRRRANRRWRRGAECLRSLGRVFAVGLALPREKLMTRKAWRGWVMGAIVAVGVGLPGSANAQFVLTKDFGAPTDVVGFRFMVGGANPPLSRIANLVRPLDGFDPQGRWTTGDLDGDGRFEVVFSFPSFSNEGHLFIFTFDEANATYIDRGEFVFIAQSDGRIFTGDVDGDGRDEVMIAAFGNATPGQRPDAGGTTPIYIIDFQTLDPPSAEVFTLPNQFITRHSQYAARDITGDGAAELLILSQNQTGTTLSNEPTGGGTLFVCSPVLGTPTASCGFTASVLIDQGPGRRYPSSIDAADFENDGIPEIVVGYGTACDPDASVTLLEVTSVTPEGPLTLGTPFQRLVVDDLDRDGSPELVVTAGAQRGGDSAAGSLRVFNFNASTRAFELVALTDAVLPSQTCSPPTVLGGTFETTRLPRARPPCAGERRVQRSGRRRRR